ncbi:MAG TPA: hypothetical protein VFX12_09000 [Vicinamibacterales bacterium]|nr:hypothetical protein [Vicinamibacterales bacterium]
MTSVLDYADFARVKARPRWIAPLALAALLSGVMPAIHNAVFGPDLIAAAAVTQLEGDLAHGQHLPPDARELVRDRIAARPLLASSVLVAVVSALAILLSAVVLNVATLLVGAEVTPAQILAVAAVAACAERLLRVLAFAVVVAILPREQVVTFDWARVGRSNLAFLGGPGAAAWWTTFVSSVDVITIVGIAVAAAGLRVMDRRLGAVRATLAASLWPVAGVAFRVLFAGMVGFPLR